MLLTSLKLIYSYSSEIYYYQFIPSRIFFKLGNFTTCSLSLLSYQYDAHDIFNSKQIDLLPNRMPNLILICGDYNNALRKPRPEHQLFKKKLLKIKILQTRH